MQLAFLVSPHNYAMLLLSVARLNSSCQVSLNLRVLQPKEAKNHWPVLYHGTSSCDKICYYQIMH